MSMRVSDVAEPCAISPAVQSEEQSLFVAPPFFVCLDLLVDVVKYWTTDDEVFDRHMGCVDRKSKSSGAAWCEYSGNLPILKFGSSTSYRKLLGAARC